jgi:L-cysteine/cystine lyase
VALSHVAWTTGAVMDVAGAARAAARVGATVLVDGAQAAGAIPVAPRALGVHAYALPAQKWLLGPEGLGAVWIDPGHREIDIAFGGVGSGVDHLPDGAMTPHRDARRWETGMLPEILVPGWRASLSWLSSLPPDDDGRSGWDRVHNGTRAAARRIREALDAAGARVLTPPGPQAGLVAFTLPGLDPEPAAAALERAGVVLRWVPHPRALRVSAGVFTSADDVRALTRGLGDLTG